ncbi:MAG: CapA family protein [Gemmatimonadetes bacterium]|nr:CapA family protein [Gemmatimonadota bacterium]
MNKPRRPAASAVTAASWVTATVATLLVPTDGPLVAAPVREQAFEDARGSISVALAGDAIITRAMRPYREPEFLALRDLIMEQTTAFVNLEVLFHDYEDDVIPAASSGGTYMRAHPELARELAWLGFDMVSFANNHTMDYGVGGARRTRKAAEAAGLAIAGFGENLAAARAPVYVDTPGGRVALISIASTFADAMRAGHQRPDHRGRPGLSPIRYETVVTLTPDQMAGLGSALGAYRPQMAGRGSISFGGVTFVEGDAPGFTTTPHEGDLAEIIEVVKEARRQATWVIVTSHTHEGAESRDVPADFIVTAARAFIDAGADIFVGHGPHILRAVEIYNGRPIFYSLANFIFQNETVELQPHDNYANFGLDPFDHPGRFQDTRIDQMGAGSFPAGKGFWESVLATVHFEDGALFEVRLHPITLGFGMERPVRGRPMLVGGDRGREILEGLADLSRPFRANLVVEDGIGVIRPN